jgi:transcriptional regulator with XRE-family HTH domain
MSAAARQLGVTKGTISRWVRAGKAPRPVHLAAISSAAPAESVEPRDWAEALRHRYVLAPHEEQLLGLAESALAMARDETQRPSVRLQAMAQFARLVAALDLPADAEDATDGKATTATDSRPWPRRA